MDTPIELSLLKNHIDISRVPFSDRGSRLLVFQDPGEDRLLVKLAERLTGIEPDIEAYLRRPPFITELYFVDEDGSPLELLYTTYPHLVCFHTRLGDFRLVFQDERTLAFAPPPGVSGIHFHVTPQFWQRVPQGGFFKSVRNVTYATSAEIISNEITPSQGGYTVDLLVRAGGDEAITVSIHPTLSASMDVPPFSLAEAAAGQRWLDWFRRVPPVAPRYRRTYYYAWWVMANNLISPQGNVLYEAMTPSKINYVGLWLWDSALHSLAYRHVDPDLARNQIRSMLAHQLPNGMLPDAVYDEGVVSTIDHPIIGEVTKPPILAWAVLKLHETAPDPVFLREVYTPLIRLNGWWFSMNDDDGDGLVQYNHPYSSGLDDSPLWDFGMPVESPDINTYLCVQMEALSAIAEIIGYPNESRMWKRREASLVRRMIKDMWDEQAGVFWSLLDEQPVPVVTPFNLYPLWTGLLPDEIASRLVARLTDPNEFWGPYPVPSVSRSDPRYNPERMWRGPVWANVNYFLIEALEKSGRDHLARELRDRTLDMVMAHPDIYEYYNAETGEPPFTAATIFGWTASVFIDLAIRASREEGY